MHIWNRSWLYRIWVVGGFIAVVAVVVKMGLEWQPSDPPPYATIGIVIGVYLGGILLMQAVAIARDRPSGPPPHADPPLTAPPAAASADTLPRDIAALRTALSLPGTSGERALQAERDAWRFSVVQFIPMAAAAILLPLAGLLFVSGVVRDVWSPFGPTGPGIPVAAIPGLVIVAVLVLLLPRTLGRARRISDDHMSPLGLSISRTPSSILLPRVGTGGVGHHLVGPTTFSGSRYGHEVVIDTFATESAVLVAVPTPDFTLTGGSGRLRPSAAAPAEVARFVEQLPKDSRLSRARVTAGPGGIRVDRKGASTGSGWLLDLWLAEHLAQLAR